MLSLPSVIGSQKVFPLRRVWKLNLCPSYLGRIELMVLICLCYVELREIWCLVLSLVQMATLSSTTFSDLGRLDLVSAWGRWLKSSPSGAPEIMWLDVWFRCSLLRWRPSVGLIASAVLSYGESLHAKKLPYAGSTALREKASGSWGSTWTNQGTSYLV